MASVLTESVVDCSTTAAIAAAASSVQRLTFCLLSGQWKSKARHKQWGAINLPLATSTEPDQTVESGCLFRPELHFSLPGNQTEEDYIAWTKSDELLGWSVGRLEERKREFALRKQPESICLDGHSV